MRAALAIEPQREPRQPLRQERESAAQLAPQRHQLEIGDVTIGERKNKVRPIVGVQANSQSLRRHGDLRSVPPLLEGFHDFRVLDLELPDPAQRIAHNRALGTELAFVGDVLELAAAAMIVHVVRTGRRDSCGTRVHDRADLRAREVTVALEGVFAQADLIAGCRAWNEDDAPIAESSYAISSHAMPVMDTRSFTRDHLAALPDGWW